MAATVHHHGRTEDAMPATAALSHLAFFEALAAEPDDRSPRWRQISAGLLTLRAFDAWLLHARRGDAPPDGFAVAAVRLAVEEIEGGSTVRPVLLGAVDAMRQPAQRADVVRGHLLAYARRLQFDSAWRLAGDVFRTFVESRPPHDVSADAMEAAFQCGYCFRMAGDVDEAALAYDTGEAIAVAARNDYGMLKARVCQAKLTSHRGNLPQAERELDAVVAAAEATGCDRALSLALTDRMAVAGRRGQYEAAATFGYRALRCCADELERERILSDLATALGDAGQRQAARDAHLVLSVTARDQSVAWLSTLNLMDLAVGDGSEVDFERHRRALAGVALPAVQRAHYHLIAGEGHARFGRHAAAVAAYRSAMASAEECGANDLLVRAESALRALEKTTRGATADAAGGDAGSVTIDEVVRAMRELRETVAAGR